MKSNSEIIKSDPVVMVEFYATGCSHCIRMKKVLDQVRELLEGEMPLLEVDIDKDPGLAKDAEVEVVPTIIIYKQGKEIWRHGGEIEGTDLMLVAEMAYDYEF